MTTLVNIVTNKLIWNEQKYRLYAVKNTLIDYLFIQLLFTNKEMKKQ